MSRETMQWLNSHQLIGFSEKRGNAWHYREDLQGDEPNHYPGAIPADDVERRLFNWEPVEGEISATVLLPDGVWTAKHASRKAIMRPPGTLGPDDEGDFLGMFSGQVGTDEGYKIHGYREWLVDQVAAILDDDLGIGGAGLLRAGAQAWVQVEIPESITVGTGDSALAFRPNLLACTSLDGSLATSYTRCATIVVCDNTMAAGLNEKGQQFKVRHTRYSNSKLADVRAALDIIHSTADDFARQVEQLTNTTVTDDQWRKFLDAHDLTSLTRDGSPKEKAALTRAKNTRDALTNLWDNDKRVTPWRNTAFGVVQARNTYAHHIRGASKSSEDRVEANMSNALSGATAKFDTDTLDTLNRVLQPA